MERRHLLASVSLTPIAADDQFSTDEDSVVLGNVLTSDRLDGSVAPGLTLRVAEWNGQPVGSSPIFLPSGAILTVEEDGDFHYDPRTSADLQGLAGGESAVDTFHYTATPQFSQIYVLGDSLSDQGQLFAATAGTFPPDPPYDQGRFSNGPVWVEQAAPGLGLATTLANNFAVAGAASGTENFNESLLGTDLPGVADELDAYLDAYGPTADPQALYVIWAGTNDFFLPFSDPAPVIANAITNIVSHVGNLQARGAQHVLVMNMPDLGSTPYGLSDPVLSGQLSAISQAFNANLAATLDSSGLAITPIDVYGRLEEITDDPDAFGLTNVTEASFDGTQVVLDPSTSLFWDSVHPTQRGHELIADLVLEHLSDQGTVSIDVSGVTTVPTLDARHESGQAGELELWLSADDASINDRNGPFEYTVDWGDGEVQSVQGTAAGVSLTHSYDALPVVTPEIRVRDQDGDSSVALREVVIWGTVGSDRIRIRPDAGGVHVLTLNGETVASLDPTNVDRVVAFGLEGDDFLSAAGSEIAVEFDGGDGRDVVLGSRADDRLIGGLGSRLLELRGDADLIGSVAASRLR
ncbi:SGNH/GDSL hydrolase family protein [Roseiconus nitratireducens]|uniref:SGNH/GDSL hydrolase family protein n=1 Tax=Roseiconus nitratireducens TaxID=2605748 RepID=UPI001375E143|nr:SGNH/GDSL hydrolase family protein [Roseiconus nitratireducens]